MKFFLLVFSISFVVLASCDKNSSEEDNNESDTKTELITKTSWQYDTVGGDFDKNGSIDFPPPAGFLPDCVFDNTITFSSNGAGTVSEGANVCAMAPATAPINWSFANNETTLNLGGGSIAGISGQFKILKLSETQLHLSKDTALAGLPVALIIQLKH